MLELFKERSGDVSFDYLTFAESCLNVYTKDDFIKAVNIANDLFEFEKAVCCMGKRKNANDLEITELVNVSFPSEWLKIYLDKNLQDVDPIVINHFKHFKPQMWTKTRKKTPHINCEFNTLVKDFALADREKEVLNWMKIGKTNWEISLILGVSERTIKFHVKNILSKLNTTTRTYAVAKAIHLSIISL